MPVRGPWSRKIDLGRIVERDRLAAQKLQADANHALTESRVLEKTNASKAADLVQDALAKVRNATELPADDRVRLVQRLQTRLREVTVVAQDQKRAEEDAARRAELKARQEARDRDQFTGPRPASSNQGPASVADRVFQDRNAQLTNNDRQKYERQSQHGRAEQRAAQRHANRRGR